MLRFLCVCLFVFAFCSIGSAQLQRPQGADWGNNQNDQNAQIVQIPLTYVPRNLSREGDFKVVVVPATNARQARLDAQTYHLGWDALDAREGQSRVMYEVLLRKRAPRVPGTPPVTRRIPR
ncbi:MAG: hypothetical protein FWG73_07035 [Planctomycetaceae bacterium]|nr:hypothetical protein [Planctomycetaceae bacterium]